MADTDVLSPKSLILPYMTSSDQKATYRGNICLSGSTLALYDGTNWTNVGGSSYTLTMSEINSVTASGSNLTVLSGAVVKSANTDGTGFVSLSGAVILARISGSSLLGDLTAFDHGLSGSAMILNGIYGTSSPPTASTTPEGTVWFKYTP